jgi:hypothetical protein
MKWLNATTGAPFWAFVPQTPRQMAFYVFQSMKKQIRHKDRRHNASKIGE